MSLALEKLEKTRAIFMKKSDVEKVNKLMIKVTSIVNNLALGNLPNSPEGTQGNGFNTLTGGDLSEYQIKLAGYKFYMADMIADLLTRAKYLEAYIKDFKARNWNRVRDEITEREGKVKNKEMIENELLIELSTDIEEQIFYEAEYNRVKMKSFAVDDILTVIVQRIAELKKQIDQSKMS